MTTKSTVLIVDDQSGARAVLQGLLAEPEYHLIFAGSGEEALARAAELPPDLVLLDVMMPGMDGFEVCHHLRTDPILAEVPILLITALDDHDSRLTGLQVGADDFISKPFDALELQARVRTVTRLNRYRGLLLERASRQQAEGEVYRRNQELSILNQVLVRAASTYDVQEVLYLACEALAQTFNFPAATAWLLNKEQNRFVDVAEYKAATISLGKKVSGNGRHPSRWNGVSEDIPLFNLLSEYLLEYETPLAVVGEPADPRLTPLYGLMRQHNLGSLLIVPIFTSNQITGLVELKLQEQRFFTQQDLTLAQSIATAIGQALESAQLYQELQHYANSLEETVSQRTRELQVERDRIRAILEALGEAVVVTNVSGTIQYCNPAAASLTGFSEEEARGQNWRLWQCRKSRDLDDQGDGPGADETLYAEIMETVGGGQTWHGEVNNTRKDGTLYDALVTVAPLTDPDNPDQLIGFVSIHSDITLLKEAERLRVDHYKREQQAAIDRLRYTFLHAVNHEMRTPLVLIFQTLAMLESPELGELTATQLDALNTLQRQFTILRQMVEGLTRVATFLSKQETVRPVPGQLTPVFNNLLPLAQFMARSKEITLETDIPPRLPFFPLDVKQMEEALTRLTENAIKFNRPGGTVKISARAADNWVLVTITDTGIGIPAEQMNRIWEVFEQGIDPVRRAQEGLGLGLVLARYIVEAHRGTIEVESTPGKGSTFTVRLPRR